MASLRGDSDTMQLPKRYADRLMTAVPDPDRRFGHILFPDLAEVVSVDEATYEFVCKNNPKADAADPDNDLVDISSLTADDAGTANSTNDLRAAALDNLALLSDDEIKEQGTALGMKIPEDGQIQRPAFDEALLDLQASAGKKRARK